MSYKISLTESFRNTLNQLDSIGEARRNPHMSERIKGHEEALQFLQKYGTKNVGVSMTSLEKLGINPGSEYNTPLGIYFYPADYYVETISNGEKLPFVSDAPYIQIFEYRGSRVWDLNDDAQSIEILNNLRSLFPNLSIDKIVEEGSQRARVKTPSGITWYVLMQIAERQSTETGKKQSVIWNQIIRRIGFDVVVDSDGSKIIHPSEPTQGVVVNPTVIRVLTQIKQAYSTDNEYKLYKNKLIRGEVDLTKVPQEVLQRHPELYKIAVSNDLGALRHAPPDPELYKIAVRKGLTLYEVPEELRTPEICKIAVSNSNDEYAWRYVPDELRTPELSKIAVSKDGYWLRYVPAQVLQQHPELCEIAVSNDGDALRFVPEEMKTPEICKIAVSKDSHALRHVPPEILRQHPELEQIAK